MRTPSDRSPKIKTHLTLDPTVRARLDDFATRTNRTLTASIEMLVTEALDARAKESE